MTKRLATILFTTAVVRRRSGGLRVFVVKAEEIRI
jgi:hypothetical protein